jgi:PIN domain nuclease of toxin-antitoxin system
MSQVIVLDTHIWFWWITEEFQRFPSSWGDMISTSVRDKKLEVVGRTRFDGSYQIPCHLVP